MDSLSRPRLLLACDGFAPGCQGGSLRAAVQSVAELSAEFDWHVLTRDRDYGSRRPYSEVPLDCWVEHAAARVRYASPAGRRPWALAELVRTLQPEVMLLNSVFSPLAVTLLALRRAGRLPAGLPVILSPSGELARAALACKAWKKAPWLRLARALNLYGGLWWRASEEREAEDIRRLAGARARVELVPELPPRPLPPPPLARPAKRGGTARLVWLARVEPKKNLLFLCAALEAARGARWELDIFGPTTDARYARRCRAALQRLTGRVQATWHGALPHARVAATLADYDALVLPSRNENFGYVVVEALAAGCPVLVSAETPWRGLAARAAGRVLPLETRAWSAALEELAALDESAHANWRSAARGLAEELAAADTARLALAALIHSALQSADPPAARP